MKRYTMKVQWSALIWRLILASCIAAVFLVGVYTDRQAMIGLGLGLFYGIHIGRNWIGRRPAIRIKRVQEAT